MPKHRWMHNVTELEAARLDDVVSITIRTDDEADHTFLFDQASFARLCDEIAQLQAASNDPTNHR